MDFQERRYFRRLIVEFKLLYLCIYMDELTCVAQRACNGGFKLRMPPCIDAYMPPFSRSFGWMRTPVINLQNDNWEIPRNIGMYTSATRDILTE